MKSHKLLQLLATGITLQQMHGNEFARFFLEDQGLSRNDAEKLTCCVAYALPPPLDAQFEREFSRAARWLALTCDAYKTYITALETQLGFARANQDCAKSSSAKSPDKTPVSELLKMQPRHLYSIK